MACFCITAEICVLVLVEVDRAAFIALTTNVIEEQYLAALPMEPDDDDGKKLFNFLIICVSSMPFVVCFMGFFFLLFDTATYL